MKIGVLKFGFPIALALVAWTPPAATQELSDTSPSKPRGSG
jgi:hypothetical protein